MVEKDPNYLNPPIYQHKQKNNKPEYTININSKREKKPLRGPHVKNLIKGCNPLPDEIAVKRAIKKTIPFCYKIGLA